MGDGEGHCTISALPYLTAEPGSSRESHSLELLKLTVRRGSASAGDAASMVKFVES